jgi:hypothetical protein
MVRFPEMYRRIGEGRVVRCNSVSDLPYMVKNKILNGFAVFRLRFLSLFLHQTFFLQPRRLYVVVSDTPVHYYLEVIHGS